MAPQAGNRNAEICKKIEEKATQRKNGEIPPQNDSIRAGIKTTARDIALQAEQLQEDTAQGKIKLIAETKTSQLGKDMSDIPNPEPPKQQPGPALGMGYLQVPTRRRGISTWGKADHQEQTIKKTWGQTGCRCT